MRTNSSTSDTGTTRRAFDWLPATGRRAAVPSAADLQQALADAPLLLTLREVAVLYRLTVRTMRRKLADGSFKIAPHETNPYRWRKVDIVADLLTKDPPARRGRPRKVRGSH